MATKLTKEFNFTNDLENWGFVNDEGSGNVGFRWKAPRRPIHGDVYSHRGADLNVLGGSASIYVNADSADYTYNYIKWRGTINSLFGITAPEAAIFKILSGGFQHRWHAATGRVGQTFEQKKVSSLELGEEQAGTGDIYFFKVNSEYDLTFLGNTGYFDWAPTRDGWGSGNNWPKFPWPSAIKDDIIYKTPPTWSQVGGGNLMGLNLKGTDVIEIRINNIMPPTPSNDPENSLFYYLADHIDLITIEGTYEMPAGNGAMLLLD